MKYAEFRIQVRQETRGAKKWSVQILACPIPGFVGWRDRVQPSFRHKHLRRLRSQENWPAVGELTELGRAVWQSVMPPKLESAFEACLATANAPDQGLRITLVTPDDLLPPRAIADDAALILPAELPIEALYHDRHGFLATNPRTPVSRAMTTAADFSTVPLRQPLRLLVAVSTPSDLPKAKANLELKLIREAIAPLTVDGGPLQVDIYEQPTRAGLTERLKACQLFHFIGHGTFAPVGNDPTSQPHISLVRQGSTTSDALSAFDLSLMLRNTPVVLALFTACVSAAPTPTAKPEDAVALGGMAQRLSSGISGIPAAVAMQLDLEADAAAFFSQSFYRHLVAGSISLDEVVTLARHEVAIQMQSGHRAWIAPVLYSRCIDGLVFTFAATPPDSDTTIKPINKRNLRNTLIGALNRDELAALCADVEQKLADNGIRLQVNLETVGGDTKGATVLKLIEYLDRRQYLAYLVDVLYETRPDLQF